MKNIHKTAIISDKAQLGKNVEIGPYVIIEDDVVIGDNVWIGPHACIYNGARIGNKVKIFQGASVSNLPQDLKYDNEKTEFRIGDATIIREFVTLHRGSKDTGFSSVGEHCMLMAYVHVAHDCVVGNNCIIANSVQIGGHVEIDDYAMIGGSTPIHQFTKVGKHTMIGGGFRIVVDIPPFVLAGSEPLRYSGINVLGLRRRGFSNEQILTLKEAYNILYRSGMNFTQAVERLKFDFPDDQHVQEIISFIGRSNRSLLRG